MEIKQDWKIDVVNNNDKYPYIIIDNWYTKSEDKAVWKELEFYNSLPKHIIDRAENTAVAIKGGKSLGKSYRWYLDFLYTKDGRYQSAILNCLYKASSPELLYHTKDLDPYHNMLKSSSKIRSLVSYYEDKDYYDEHFDTYHWTLLIWYFKEPKKFKGGDFCFTVPKSNIECKHNRAVLFPSCYTHKITPIEMNNSEEEKNGRYTITHFYTHDENEKQFGIEFKKYENNNT